MKSQELLARKTKTWKTTHQFIPIVITMIALVWIIVSAAEPIKASAISDKTVNITSGSQQIYWGTEPGYSFSYYPASVFSNSATTPPTYSYTGKNYIFTVNAHTGKNQRRGQIYAWKNGKLAGTLTVVQAGHTHSYNKGWQTRKAATCGTTGIQYKMCRICGYEVTQTIPATGNHYWDGWIIDKQASCTVPGSKHRVCRYCGKKQTQTIASTGHSYKAGTTESPTCTSGGRQKYTCTKCGNSYWKTISPAYGHVYKQISNVARHSATHMDVTLKCARCAAICNCTESSRPVTDNSDFLIYYENAGGGKSFYEQADSLADLKQGKGNNGINTYMFKVESIAEFQNLWNYYIPKKVRNIYYYGHQSNPNTIEFKGQTLNGMDILYGKKYFSRKKVSGRVFMLVCHAGRYDHIHYSDYNATDEQIRVANLMNNDYHYSTLRTFAYLCPDTYVYGVNEAGVCYNALALDPVAHVLLPTASVKDMWRAGDDGRFIAEYFDSSKNQIRAEPLIVGNTDDIKPIYLKLD